MANTIFCVIGFALSMKLFINVCWMQHRLNEIDKKENNDNVQEKTKQ